MEGTTDFSWKQVNALVKAFIAGAAAFGGMAPRYLTVEQVVAAIREAHREQSLPKLFATLWGLAEVSRIAAEAADRDNGGPGPAGFTFLTGGKCLSMRYGSGRTQMKLQINLVDQHNSSISVYPDYSCGWQDGGEESIETRKAAAHDAWLRAIEEVP